MVLFLEHFLLMWSLFNVIEESHQQRTKDLEIVGKGHGKVPNHKQMYGRRGPDQSHPALTWPVVTIFGTLCLPLMCTFSSQDNTQTSSICEGRPLIFTKFKILRFSQFYFISDVHVWRYISLQYCKGTSWPRSHCKSWSRNMEQSCPGNNKKLISVRWV